MTSAAQRGFSGTPTPRSAHHGRDRTWACAAERACIPQTAVALMRGEFRTPDIGRSREVPLVMAVIELARP